MILYIISKTDYSDSKNMNTAFYITILAAGIAAGAADAVTFQPFVLLTKDKQLEVYYTRIYEDAAYVDSVLDTVGEERYQFLGINGSACYWCTEHLPQGPVFFQYTDMLRDEDSWFSESFKEQLDKTNVILFDYEEFNGDALREYTLKLLENEFTEELPDGVQQPPERFGYILLFRKSCSEFWADGQELQPFDTSTLFSDIQNK